MLIVEQALHRLKTCHLLHKLTADLASSVAKYHNDSGVQYISFEEF